MVTKSNVFQLSLFAVCTFPLFTQLQHRAYATFSFVVLQLILSVWQFNRSKKGLWFLWLQLMPVLLLAASLLYSQNVDIGLKKLETNIMLVLIPLVLFLNRALFTVNTQRKTMLFFTAVATLISSKVIFKMIATGKLAAVLQVDGGYYFIRTYLEEVSHFHPTYFSLLLAIALFTLINEAVHGFSKRIFWIPTILSAVIISMGLLLAMSKMILASIFVIGLLLSAIHLDTRKVKWVLLGACLSAFVVIAAVKPIRQRAFEFVQALSQSNVDPNNPDSMRKAVYRGTFDVIQEHPILGAGVGDVQMKLDRAYEKRGFALAKERSFNTHNNYLNWWVTAGVFAAFIFVLLQFSQIGIALASKNQLHLAITVLLSFSMLTENLLMRQDGVFTYAFFSSFLIYASWVRHKGITIINGKFLSQSLTGVQRFAHEIAGGLQELSSEYAVVTPVTEASELAHKRVRPFTGTLWEQITLPIYMRLIGSRPLLSLCNTAPILYRYNYLTLHDVAFAENSKWFAESFIKWYSFMIPRILKRSKEIFTVSKFSKHEIQKHFNIPANLINVVYNGIPDFAQKENNQLQAESSDNFLLMVGSFSKRKNQDYIIHCFAQWKNAPCRLVLAGSNVELLAKENSVLKLAKESPNIELVFNPNDDELHALYQKATACIYTPYYEGFGIPVLEALAFKKPIIVSDIPVFRELFEGYVTFVRLEDELHLKEVIARFFDPEMKNQVILSTDISQLMTKFSYAQSAKEIHSKLTKG